MKASRGKVIDDPFTRRSTKPRMSTMVNRNDEDSKPVPENPIPVFETVHKPATKEKEVPEVKKKQNTDLFNAHNFDITIDLEVPHTRKCFNVNVILNKHYYYNFCLQIIL